MGCTRREFLALASMGTVAGAAACTPQQNAPNAPANTGQGGEAVDASKFKSLALDPSAWSYDEANDAYYQLGLTYCKSPATTTYESLAVFVPGAFLTGENNGENYTCTLVQMAAAFCGKEKLDEKQKTLIQSLIEELGDDLDC